MPKSNPKFYHFSKKLLILPKKKKDAKFYFNELKLETVLKTVNIEQDIRKERLTLQPCACM